MTNFFESLLFIKIFNIPFIVLWLGCISVFITIRMRFINITGLKHAFDILRGKFNGQTSKEQITPFQALMSSMAATLGTGSIVGVAVAVSKGGPGAVFWMMVFGFFGMSVKCVEVYFGHKYRQIDEDGTITGGPFIYLKKALAEIGFAKFGVILAMLFAFTGFFGVLGTAGFQANQITAVFAGQDSIIWKKIIVSFITTSITAYILLGGVQRIASIADKIVPFMVVLYVGTVIYIIFSNLSGLKFAFQIIWHSAFDFSSGMTAFLAMVAIGARRAIFACEAGQGTSPIVNSTSNVKYSQRQGLINIFDPLITTWVVCLSSALVVIVSGLHTSQIQGADLIQKAFEFYNPIFGYVVIISILFFAITTLITDSYYFHRIAKYLKVPKPVIYGIFFTFVFLAGILHLDTVIAFADIFVLLMAIFNTFGLYFISGIAVRDFKAYFKNNKNDTEK